MSHKMQIIFITILSLFLLSFSAVSYSKSLISIEFNDTPSDYLQELDIYHITRSHVIAEATSEQLKALDSKNYAYQLIDSNPWSSTYYLISNPRGEGMRIQTNWGKVLYQNEDIALIKTDKLPEQEVIAADYKFVEMKKITLSTPPEYLSPQLSRERNEFLEEMVAEIHPDSIAYVIQTLQNFGTRFCYADNRLEVALWIKNRFHDVGIQNVEIDSFYYNGVMHRNIVATIPGSVYPDEYVIIGGHYDSIVNSGDPYEAAPGADDNASGSAAALELARVFKAMNYQPKYSVQFMTYAAEEVGLVGSYYNALRAQESGKEIRLMLNNDMISNNTAAPGEWTVNLNYYTGYEHLRDYSAQLAEQYTTLQTVPGGQNSSGSDSYYYWAFGYPVTYYAEYEFSPYYHSIQDVIGHCDLDYCAEVIRLDCSLLVNMVEMPMAVEDLEIWDGGDGNSLYATWTYPEDDIDHFKLGIGTSPGSYDEYYTTTEMEFTFTNLEEGELYYISISAVNSGEWESFLVEENGRTFEIPRTPSEFTVEPTPDVINVQWAHNPELDLAGYKIYRSEIDGEEGELLNEELYTDNLFEDTSAEAGIKYYYSVKAVDDVGNISEPTEALAAYRVTLDQGILVVDATVDGNGNFMFPTDEECDLYYQALMDDFATEMWDLQEHGSIRLGDMAAFSTVFLYMDTITDNPLIAQAIPEFVKYFDYSGNMLISGYKPTQQFVPNSGYPAEFTEGEFVYDYLKIGSNYFDSPARFYSAVPTSPARNFESIMVDTLKTPASLDHHLLKIESITPNSDGETIYNFSSLYDDESTFGSMNGMSVSAAYFDSEFNSVVLPFPLYYMDFEDSQAFIHNLLVNYFGETGVEIGNYTDVPEKANLEQNYPNPFNPTTTIHYSLPNTSAVAIRIYDVSGKLVKTLVNEEQEAGYHSVKWNGKDERHHDVSSGVYIYRLESEKFNETKRCVLLK